jgi:hypothetical protein
MARGLTKGNKAGKAVPEKKSIKGPQTHHDQARSFWIQMSPIERTGPCGSATRW